MDHAPFPSDEMLSAYIDGTLDEATRKKIAEHVADCPDCADVVAFSQEVKAEVAVAPAANVKPFPARGAVISLLAAAAVAAIAFFVTPIRNGIENRIGPDPIRDVAAVPMKERPFAAQLAGLPYHPKAPNNRGGGEEGDANVDLLDTIVNLSERAARNPSPRNLHALGVAELLDGNHKPEALEALTAAAKADPNNAAYQSDVSAALLVMNRESDALAAADRALKLNPTLAPAAFNRALILETMGQREDEKRAWQQVIAIEPGSGWANEARQRISYLSAP